MAPPRLPNYTIVMESMTKPSIIVIGAGAAGLMASIFAAEAGARVRLLERTSDGGRKILISGGGRCNVLPSKLSPSQYFTGSSPNSLKKMLGSWPLAQQRAFFEEDLGISLAREEETGKLFPVSNRARDVRDGLVERARAAGVEILYDAKVTDVRRGPGEDAWTVRLEGAPDLIAGAVVLSTGGLSVPKTGSDGIGLRIARDLGHTIHETYPALTPLTAEPAVHAPLAGISLSVKLEAPTPDGRFTSEGGFLFTHRGYSGPSVLDLSHFAVRSADDDRQLLLVQWTDADRTEWDERLQQRGTGTVASLIKRSLPDRLAEALIAEADVEPTRDLAQLRRDERMRLTEKLARYPLPWTGDEGYKKAEVTGGGVALAEVDPRTMESRVQKGLYLCGEILDAFGPIGGYNFAWAWATGRAAGMGAARTRNS